MVHPKVITKSVSVESEIGDDGIIRHSAIPLKPKKGQDPKPKLLDSDPELYTHEDAKAALQVLTSFLNIFVQWWGVGCEVAETYLFQTLDGSINARQVMFRKNQIFALIRNDHFLNIQFMGGHGMFDQE
jgi:hypothetical protein